jgi:AraC family transcriptional regulator
MRPQTEQTYQERILRVLVHIQTNLSEALALDDLAAVARFSPYHFHRIFRGMVGESVKEHVRRLRLERAAHRLKHGDQPITWVAFEAGYETHEAFTRAFGAMFGTPPSQFRELRRSPPGRNGRSGIHYDPEGRLDGFQPLRAGGRPVDVRVESVPVLRVAFMRHTGPYEEVRGTWEKLMAWAGPRGLLGWDTTILAVPHDDPDVTPPEKVRYDACIVVDERFRPEGEVGVQQVGGGEYAVATHRGPYRTIGETFDSLCGEWLPTSGREVRSAPPFVVYRNTPEDAAPEDLLTDVYMPLAPQE